MTNVSKEAAKDAAEYARADVYFGEGAGTRRKLIGTTVDYKSQHTPGYDAAFQKALADQDWEEHVKKARRERRRVDGKKSVDKNLRAAASGNWGNMSTNLLIAGGVAYVMHASGADKKVWSYTKEKYEKARRSLRARKLKPVPSEDGTYNITNITNP